MPEGTKQGETKDTPAPGAPTEYEAFTLPDGWTITDDDTAAFGEVAREMNLDQSQAQQFVDFFVKIEESRAAELGDGLSKLKEQADADERAGWQAELQKDPEFESNRANIKVLEQSGLLQSEFTKLLVESGWMMRPEVVKQLGYIGSLLQENGTGTGDETPATPSAGARVLFDKSGHDA